METVLALVAGTFYGLVIGIIPSAGATTGLIALFGVIHYFASEPYLGVIFVMAAVAASTTGDSFAAILLGIPGANSAAATMVDGHPLAKQGRASLALSAAITTSTVNGLLWGSLVFLFLPYYGQLILILGIPELWGFIVLALVSVGFVSNNFPFRSILAICIGIYLGLIGVNPETNAPRFTMGWFYLQDGIQLMPVVAGLFAIPELIIGFNNGSISRIVHNEVWTGIRVTWKNRWLALRGGFIGAFIGLLPGIGGAAADWMSYGSTVAAYPKEEFGNGNIKGVIGPEGANNAQKATSMIPTVLFGIPGAPFAAIVMALFMYLNFELGTVELMQDTKFFVSMSFGFLAATIVVAILCLVFIKPITRICTLPWVWYGPIIIIIITWSCMQYTGGWEDLVMLMIFSSIGWQCIRYRISRPALLIAFILADKVESYTLQLISLYTPSDLLNRPGFIILCVAIVALFLWSIKKRRRVDFA